MPVFEYKCNGCGFEDEVLVKSASAKPPKCEKCQGKMTKQFSSFAAVVKVPAPASNCHSCPSAGGCPNAR